MLDFPYTGPPQKYKTKCMVCGKIMEGTVFGSAKLPWFCPDCETKSRKSQEEKEKNFQECWNCRGIGKVSDHFHGTGICPSCDGKGWFPRKND